MIHKEEMTTQRSFKPLSIKTILGSMTITKPVLIDLIESQAVQRLKGIHQYGVSYYAQKPNNYTRYGHSLGVLHILKIIDAPITEQIAGLLHDVSHTVFSHVADTLFDHQSETSSYQDDIHLWFLEQTDIPKILRKHGFTVQQIMHKENNFKALERDLPELCADRIEYLLQGGFHEAIIPHYQVKKIMDALCFENDRWYFTDMQRARELALCALYLTEHHFGAQWNVLTYYLASDMLKHALCKGIITKDDIHFSQDDTIWHRLRAKADGFIGKKMQQIKECPVTYKNEDESVFDVHVKPKFRGVDPWIQTADGFARLSELDALFKEEFERVKAVMRQGCYLKLS
jgi:HD superfamily phosphohydrolase